MSPTKPFALPLEPMRHLITRLIRLLALASVLTPLTGHTGTPAGTQGAAFASKGFAEVVAGCRLPDTCGGKKPRKSQAEPMRETGNDNLIEEHTVQFDGLAISFLFLLGNASNPSPSDWKKGKPYPPPFVTDVKITSPDWPVRNGLQIGVTRAAVESALGKLTINEDGCARITDEATMSEVALCFNGGKLSSLEWTPWWDG